MASDPRNSQRQSRVLDSPSGSPSTSLPRQLASERLSASPHSLRISSDLHNSALPSSYVPSQSYRSELSHRSALGDAPDSDDANSITIDPEEAARVVKRHLVTQPRGDDDDDDSLAPNSDWDDEWDDSAPGSSTGRRVLPNSHRLLGGDTTRHIYKWTEDMEHANLLRKARSQSVTDLVGEYQQLPPNATASATAQLLKQPGGFRRQYLAQRADQEGQPPPNFLTANFIDFITLYGHFAGDEFPSDIDDDDYEGPPDMSYSPSYRDSSLYRRRAYAIEVSDSDAFSDDQEPARTLRRPPTERTPLRRRQPQPRVVSAATASPRKAFFLLIKSFVGTGVLFLPRSFYNGGLTFSAIVLASVAYLALYAMLLLVQCYSKIPGSFGDIGLRLYGPGARYAVLTSLVLSQIGFCCAYTVFVAQNMQQLVQTVTDCRFNPGTTFWIFLQLAVYIPLAMVRKIKNFSLAALVADVFILMGLGYLYYFDIHKLATVGAATIKHFNGSSFSLFIGTAVFSFEGIGLVLPIVSSMKDPRRFPSVLTLALTVSATIFVSIGALSYLAFGDKVETVVLLNLPKDSRVVHMVQLLYSLAIMFSVPLQMFPAIRILEAGLFVRSGKGNPWVKWQKNLFRCLLALFVALVALVGAEKLDRFVALIGSFACVPLSFIYPALFHLKAVARTRRMKIIDTLLVIFGFVCMVYVTYQSIESWIFDELEPAPSHCPTPH